MWAVDDDEEDDDGDDDRGFFGVEDKENEVRACACTYTRMYVRVHDGNAQWVS